MAVGGVDSRIGDLIDLERYPVDDIANPSAAVLVAEGRASLERTGICSLPGFLRPGVAARLAAETAALTSEAHRRSHDDIPYGRYRDRQAEFPASHPVRMTSLFRMGLLSYDRLPEDGGIKRIYHWDGLTRLVAALTDSPSLYRTADPLLSCNVSVLGPGDTHGWHVDGNDFSVTLLLQEPEAGGQFEFLPAARPCDENFEAVARLFAGSRAGVVVPRLEPGMLSVFRGRWSMHHVTRVEGARPRVQIIFSYHHEPGMTFPEATRRNYLGRVA